MNWNFLINLIFAYLLLNIFVFFIADFMMYPNPVSSYQDHQLPQQFKITANDGKKISVIYLENPKARYTVLVSHGNAEDLGLLLPFLEALHSQGFSVFAYDYHGYGSSEGRTTEKNTYRDIHAAYDYLINHLKLTPEQIILYGRSLGTGPTLELATELATREKIAGIILESPMMTAFRVVTVYPVFLLDKYPNNLRIQKMTVPLLIIHGTADKVIPVWHGQALFKLATTSSKTFFPVQGAGHNDVIFSAGQSYWEAINQFANSLNLNNSKEINKSKIKK